MLRQLRGLVVSIALDDFGTGYSSLSYLRDFPIDRIKIDRSFIAALDQGGEDAMAVMKSICGIGRALHLGVTAEGIETKLQMDAVRAGGCSIVQGWLIGKPMTGKQLERKYFQALPAVSVTS